MGGYGVLEEVQEWFIEEGEYGGSIEVLELEHIIEFEMLGKIFLLWN